ncbi:hypothetical protein BDZ97DRAFT_1654581, partial [Flammula alnicola]
MDISLSQFLGTNFVPSDAEVQQIKEYLISPTAELARLDIELEELKLRRQRVYTHIQGYKALISPARRLPREILEEIFICCLPSDHNAVMSVLEAPMNLGRICSLWRSIAYTTPRLWSSLH